MLSKDLLILLQQKQKDH